MRERANKAKRVEMDAVWARYRDNLARHLIGISRDLQSRVMRQLSEQRGFDGLRPSFGPLLSLVWMQGRPLTTLAGHLAITKQACGQLVDLAEAEGYLERRPDPLDRRAKLVCLAPLGQRLVKAAVEVILETDTEYADLVGTAAYRRFATSLAALYQGLRIPTHANPALTAEAGRSSGVLPMIAVRIERDLMEATVACGHGGLKMSHAQVLPLVGREGSRVHEIAREQRVSRQAISATARDLEELGYVERHEDPGDARGVVLRLSNRGTCLIRDSVHALDGLEESFAAILGGTRLEALQRISFELYRALHLEQDIFSGASGNHESERSDDPGSHGLQRSRDDIQRLAERLRRQLGERDTERLAAVLSAGPKQRRGTA